MGDRWWRAGFFRGEVFYGPGQVLKNSALPVRSSKCLDPAWSELIRAGSDSRSKGPAGPDRGRLLMMSRMKDKVYKFRIQKWELRNFAVHQWSLIAPPPSPASCSAAIASRSSMFRIHLFRKKVNKFLWLPAYFVFCSMLEKKKEKEKGRLEAGDWKWKLYKRHSTET